MQVLPKQLIAAIVKIAEQIVLILNHQGPALPLQRKHVASEVNTTLLKPPKESTPRAGRSITIGCYYDEDFASSLGRLFMFSIVEECGSGRKLLKNL